MERLPKMISALANSDKLRLLPREKFVSTASSLFGMPNFMMRRHVDAALPGKFFAGEQNA